MRTNTDILTTYIHFFYLVGASICGILRHHDHLVPHKHAGDSLDVGDILEKNNKLLVERASGLDGQVG